LAVIVAEDGPAQERLRRWFELLITSKRRRTLDDPELFSTYIQLTTQARDVVKAHVDRLVGQITQIIADGIAQGEFAAADPVAAGRAVFDATTRFHNPAHASEWSNPGLDAAFEGVWSLILAGLGGVRSQA
jgi:hypothetical protein